jgi:thioesterase domain-containing protein
VEQIRRVDARGPYHLGGYCFGGVVAFEMARQLKQAGSEVAMLAVIDAAPRNLPQRDLRAKVVVGINGGLRVLEKMTDALSSSDPLGALRGMFDRAALRRRTQDHGAEVELDTLRDRMEGLDGWPLAYQRIARVHHAALLRYVPGFYDGRLTLIRTAHRLQRWGVEDETWGWDRVAREVAVHRVPGRHDEIMNEPHVKAVADVLSRSLLGDASAASARSAGVDKESGASSRPPTSAAA